MRKTTILRIRMSFLFTLLVLQTLSIHAQTFYSTFSSPSNGTNYWFWTSGVCVGCAITDPSNAVSTSITDSSRLLVVAGVLNGATIRMRLTDSANSSASVVIRDNNGNLNLGNVVINTYFNGTLKQSFSGSSNISISNLSGSKNELSVAANQTYNEIQVTFNGFISLVWDVQLYYGKGIYIAPLPVKFIDIKGAYEQTDRLNIEWSYMSDPSIKKFNVYGYDDQSNSKLLGSISASKEENCIPVNSKLLYECVGMNPQQFYIETIYEDGSAEKTGMYPITNLREIKLQTNLYPNPSHGTINIQSQLPGSLKIYDINSRLVLETQLTHGQNTIDISQLENGIYVVEVEVGGRKEVWRVGLFVN